MGDVLPPLLPSNIGSGLMLEAIGGDSRAPTKPCFVQSTVNPTSGDVALGEVNAVGSASDQSPVRPAVRQRPTRVKQASSLTNGDTTKRQEKRIVLYKKKTAPKLSTANIEELINGGSVLVESEFTIGNALSLLKVDLSVAKIVELSIRDFNSKVSS